MMTNKYCRVPAERRSASAHELKDVGDRGGRQPGKRNAGGVRAGYPEWESGNQERQI
ncbi:hypothetical protein [Citrobacter amalonaticus]|uniref:hypothetical protein n=1 Tax=Citrobacter amalonaticus TaxID=35703 RepID=UPI0015E16EDA|nr:hypothetical protein [Citrobacter amalonaticus]